MRRILSLGSGNRGFKERREALFSTLESHDGLTDGYRSEKEKKDHTSLFSVSHTGKRKREKTKNGGNQNTKERNHK